MYNNLFKYADLFEYAINTLDEKDYCYKDLIEVIKKIFASIAPKLNVGYIKYESKNSINIYSKEKISYENILYESEKYNKNGELYYISPIKSSGYFKVSVYPIDNFTEEEKKCISCFNYIFSSAIKKANQQKIIEETPFLDPLTGYLNTSGIHEFLGMLCATNRIDKYSTLFVNIKECGALNRLCGGVQFGDVLLRQYANTIKNSLDEDETIGRHGGDNFTIVVKKENTDKILNLLKGINVSANINGKFVSSTVESVVGCYDNEAGDDVANVMDCSMTCMAICKRIKNTNILRYNDALKENISLTRKVKATFYQAMQEGRIIPYYQPKVDSSINELCGAEALCRWVNYDGKLIPPNVFIKALEDDGSICDLDFCILDRVCKDISKQIDSGLSPVPVSVNFSKYHFLKKDIGDNFVNKIIDTITENGVDPKYIEIEFTESGKVEDYYILRNIVNKLHKVGIKVSIDDYGTGYSSLQLLESIPFDIIKMDKSFADSIGTDGGNVIFTYTTEMMKKLGKDVVCEGAETTLQIEFLRNIDCNIIQGYYYDRPLKYDDYITRLKNKKYKTKERVK